MPDAEHPQHLLEAARQLAKAGRTDEALAAFEKLLEHQAGVSGEQPEGVVEAALLGKATVLVRLGRAQEAEATCDVLLAPGDDLGNLRSKVLLTKAVAVNAQGRGGDAIDLVDELLATTAGADDTIEAKALELKARALERRARALLADAQSLAGESRYDEAVRLLDRLPADLADVRPSRRPQLAADASFLRGVYLGEAGRRDESVAAFDDLIARYGDDPAPPVRDRVANAMYFRAGYLAESGQRELALELLVEVVDRFGSSTSDRQRLAVARAMMLQGAVHLALGARTEAARAWSAAIERFGDAPSEQEQGLAVEARARLADTLGAMSRDAAQGGDDAGAVTILEDLTERLGHEREPAVRRRVARANAAKVAPLLRLGRTAEAIAISERLKSDLDAETEPSSAAALGEHVLAVARVLARAGRPEPALSLLDGVVSSLHAAVDPAARTLAARAQLDASIALGELGRLDEAIAAYDAVFDFGADALPVWETAARRARERPREMRAQLAQALLGRAITLSTAGRRREALESFEAIVDGFAADDAALAAIIATARQGRDELLADDEAPQDDESP